MEIIKAKIGEVKPYGRNPRKNDGAVEAVAESIRQCGYVAPIIVDEDMVVLAGHTRLKALKRLGRKEVEVLVKEGLSEAQKRKYRLLDNKTAEFAEWDESLLDLELEGLDFDGFDFGFVFDSEEPEALEDDYEVELPEEPRTKPGDVWILGAHRLVCGDITDPDVVTVANGGGTGRPPID